MDQKTLLALRLHNQRLATGRLPAHELLAHMAAMQAQDYYGALWSVGIRTGLTEKQVVGVLERREIVRTWPQRGTLHLVLPEDVAWTTGLSAARLLQKAKRRHEQLGLDEAQLERSKELFAVALQGGKALARPQMMEVLETAGIGTKGGRGYHMLWHAAQIGQTYIGPMEGKQQTFGLVADLPASQRRLGREEAVAEWAKRYFTSHGPATLQDFMWWSGLTAVEAKAGLAANAGVLVPETYEGREYWLAAASAKAPKLPEALLLAGFDEYLLGYKDRSAQMEPEHSERVVPGGNGMFAPTVVLRGRVAGTWKRTLKQNRVLVAVQPFEPLTAADRQAVEAAAQGYGRFLELPVEISF